LKRREIFDRLSVGAEERMTPILSEAIDEIASRDAEVAELRNDVKMLINLLSKFRDDVLFRVGSNSQYRTEVLEPYNQLVKQALSATKHHDRS
jgi:hypothetical protein